MVGKDIKEYNSKQTKEERSICDLLAKEIDINFRATESKVWHAHPVWFVNGNPTVGYSRQKRGIRLMFWSGDDFNEDKLEPGKGKFKDASIFYNSTNEVNTHDLRRWLKKAEKIQWDYKNIVKRKGKLIKIKLL